LFDLDTILKQCKKRDKNSQAALYAWLSPKLLGLCRRYLSRHEEAEDAMQDAFVKIFTRLDTFKSEGSFEGWARRIAVNTALDQLKKNKRITFERSLELVEYIDFEDEEIDQVTERDLLSCIDKLPTGYRTILNLFLAEDYSHREIAEQLNISESTSRSQYTRARQALLKLLKEQTGMMNTKKA